MTRPSAFAWDALNEINNACRGVHARVTKNVVGGTRT
jgi:hypothetical protein